MILRNYTPFVPLLFQGRDVAGRDFWVLVLRGTFRIVPEAPLQPDPEQQPIALTDVFHGEVNASSVLVESDLAPFKVRSDIHVNAVARAPLGYEARDWVVEARVGKVEKSLRVTGPRQWVKQGGEWRLTEPEPCVEVPIRYEHAFGGVWANNWGDSEVFEENPIGVGYLKEGQLPSGDVFPAPQIEALEDPVTEIGKVYKPQGLGAITRSWLPRRAQAGTFDDAWKRERWPELPADFNFSFYNSAHPDLLYPGYLQGEEEVELRGLCPEGLLRFTLPDYRVVIFLHFRNRALTGAKPVLDTLVIDVPAGRAFLTWRAAFPKIKGLEAIEPRMTSSARRRHGKRRTAQDG